MSLLVTGSIGIDTVKTPYGVSENCLGGSAKETRKVNSPRNIDGRPAWRCYGAGVVSAIGLELTSQVWKVTRSLIPGSTIFGSTALTHDCASSPGQSTDRSGIAQTS